MDDLPGFLVVVGLLLVSFFGAVAQTAFSRLTRARAHQLLQERKTKRASRLVEIVDDPAPYLNVLLLVVVTCHLFSTALVTSWAIEGGRSFPELVAAVVMVVVVFVFAQIVPKTYAIQRAEAAGVAMAGVVFWLGRVLGPLADVLVRLANATMILLPGRGIPRGPFVTEDEIRHLVDVAEEEEEIEQEERELIHSIFEFGDTVVREVMVPRPDMVTIKADASFEEALQTILKKGYSRIPVFEGDTDNIVGVLYAKDLMKRLVESKKAAKVGSLGRAPLFVPEQKKVADLMREMQEQHVHMAIVVDEYGGTAGLVTIEDLIEEIVGEIVDEYDREERLVETVSEGSVRVDARVPIDELNELLGVDLPDEEWDTVGGLVFGLTGRVPSPGETVRYDSVEFTTERVLGRRIKQVLVSKQPQEPAREAAT